MATWPALFSISLLLIGFIHRSWYLRCTPLICPLTSSLSILVTSGLLSISVRVFLFFAYTFVCSIFYILHVSNTTYYLSFYFWHISLNIMFSKPIHTALNCRTSYFFYCWGMFHCVHVGLCEHIPTAFFLN